MNLEEIPINIRPHLLSLLIEKIDEGILLEDVDGDISFVTPRAAEILGFTIRELLGREWASIIPSEELDKISSESEKLSEGIPYTFRINLLRKDYKRIPVIITAMPVSSESDGVNFIITVFKDISDRKQAEDELRISEERHRMLIDFSPDALTLSDLDANIILVNRQTTELFGYDTKEELIGKSTYELISPDDQLRALENTNKLYKQGSVHNVKYTLVRKDGSFFSADVSVNCITDDLKEPVAFSYLIKDLSETNNA